MSVIKLVFILIFLKISTHNHRFKTDGLFKCVEVCALGSWWTHMFGILKDSIDIQYIYFQGIYFIKYIIYIISFSFRNFMKILVTFAQAFGRKSQTIPFKYTHLPNLLWQSRRTQYSFFKFAPWILRTQKKTTR